MGCLNSKNKGAGKAKDKEAAPKTRSDPYKMAADQDDNTIVDKSHADSTDVSSK